MALRPAGVHVKPCEGVALVLGGMTMSPDPLVVGGGAIGVCAAFEAPAAAHLSHSLNAARHSRRAAQLETPASSAQATPHRLPLPGRFSKDFAGLLLGRSTWKPESPFYLRLLPGVLPWIARFAMAWSRRACAHVAAEIMVLCAMPASPSMASFLGRELRRDLSRTAF